MRNLILSSFILLITCSAMVAQDWSAFTGKYTFYNNKLEQKSMLPAKPQSVVIAKDRTLFAVAVNGQPFSLSAENKLPVVDFAAGLKELGFNPKNGLNILYDEINAMLYAHNGMLFASKKINETKWQGFNLDEKLKIKPSGKISTLECTQITGSVINKNGNLTVSGIRNNAPVFATLTDNNWTYAAPDDFIKAVQEKYKTKGFTLTFGLGISGGGNAVRIGKGGFDIIPAPWGNKLPYPVEFLFYDLVADKNGDLWFLSNQQLYKWTNGQLKKISDKTIQSISVSQSGDIYASTSVGVEKVEENGNFKIILNKLVTSFYVDAANILWFVPEEKTEEKQGLNLSKGVKAGIKDAMAENKKQNELMPYKSSDLVRYDMEKGLTFVLNPLNSPLSGSNISCITADEKGYKYIVNENGIYILKEPVEPINEPMWKILYPYQVNVDDFVDNQWCVANKGLVISKNKLGFVKNGQVEFHDIKLPDVKNMSNQFYNYFSCVAADKNNTIYIGTRLKGVFKYGEKICTDLGLDIKTTGKEIRALVFDKNNNLWIGAEKALAKYDGQTFTYYTKKNSELLNSEINALFVDDSNVLWIATDGGLYSFDGSTWQSFTKKENGLKSDKIEALAGYSKTIYFAASGELHILKNGTVKVEDSSKEKALSHIQDNGLFVSENGKLWIVARGITLFSQQSDGVYTKYDNKNSPLPKSSIVRNMTFADGILHLHLEQSGLFGTGNSGVNMGNNAQTPLPGDNITSSSSERFYSFSKEMILSITVKQE